MRGLTRWAAGLTAIAALTVVGCTRVPVTNRVQMNLVPRGIMTALGKTTYKSILRESRIQRKGQNATVLKGVGRKISRTANEPKFDWEFAMIKDPMVNAWCLPGGKVGVYSGILPALKNEAGMAFVVGHEVGHATANHGSERLSQKLALFGGLAGLAVLADRNTKMSPRQRNTALAALGVAGTVGIILPFSRKHEAEADVIGMMYMARAGYPPGESIKVWDRMSKLSGPGLPAFISTHPSHGQRKKNLREWMPKAKKRFERNRLPGDKRTTLWPGIGPDNSGGHSGGSGGSRENSSGGARVGGSR